MDQPHWLERLTGATRFQVLQLLLRADRTVQEIAEEIGVSANAIRTHVASLERDGLVVSAGTRRDTGGKPATTYTISDEADELFPKAYAFVLEGLLGVLEERLGGDGVRDILREVGSSAATAAQGTPEERVETTAAVLRSLGGTVEIERMDGGFKIVGFACPLSAAVRADARVCGLAEALVHTTSGGAVREVCERNGRPRCAFEISFSETTPQA